MAAFRSLFTNLPPCLLVELHHSKPRTALTPPPLTLFTTILIGSFVSEFTLVVLNYLERFTFVDTNKVVQEAIKEQQRNIRILQTEHRINFPESVRQRSHSIVHPFVVRGLFHLDGRAVRHMRGGIKKAGGGGEGEGRWEEEAGQDSIETDYRFVEVKSTHHRRATIESIVRQVIVAETRYWKPPGGRMGLATARIYPYR